MIVYSSDVSEVNLYRRARAARTGVAPVMRPVAPRARSVARFPWRAAGPLGVPCLAETREAAVLAAEAAEMTRVLRRAYRAADRAARSAEADARTLGAAVARDRALGVTSPAARDRGRALAASRVTAADAGSLVAKISDLREIWRGLVIMPGESGDDYARPTAAGASLADDHGARALLAALRAETARALPADFRDALCVAGTLVASRDQ